MTCAGTGSSTHRRQLVRPQRLWVSGDLGQTQLLRGLQPEELIYHSFSIQALILLHPQTLSTTAPASGSLAEDVTLTTGPCFSDPVPCPAAAGQCQGLLYSKLHPSPALSCRAGLSLQPWKCPTLWPCVPAAKMGSRRVCCYFQRI